MIHALWLTWSDAAVTLGTAEVALAGWERYPCLVSGLNECE